MTDRLVSSGTDWVPRRRHHKKDDYSQLTRAKMKVEREHAGVAYVRSFT